MRAHQILSHMALANVLVLSTLVGLAGMENDGGYLAMFLSAFSPFVLGVQVMHIIHSFME